MQILEGIPKAKAFTWAITDIETRKYGEKMGLETPVFHTVNYECSFLDILSWNQANALSTPPEEYSRKAETQRT